MTKLSSGLILQWGVGNGYGYTYFYKPFPHAVFQISIAQGAGDNILGYGGLTTSGFQLYGGDTGGNWNSRPWVTGSYIAVGW